MESYCPPPEQPNGSNGLSAGHVEMDGGAVGEVRGVKNAAAAAAATKHFQSQCLIYLNGFRLFDNVSALSPPTEQIVKRENLTRKAQRKHSNRVLLTVTSFLEKTTWTGKNRKKKKNLFFLSLSDPLFRVILYGL